MDLATTLGWTATTLFTACYIPQIIKTRRTGKIEGLSFLLLAISFIANIVAFCYATLIKQQPLQTKYTLALIFLGFTLYEYLKVYMKLRRKPATSTINEIYHSIDP
jgi:uncharacterized protein with PQ loop repeat